MDIVELLRPHVPRIYATGFEAGRAAALAELNGTVEKAHDPSVVKRLSPIDHPRQNGKFVAKNKLTPDLPAVAPLPPPPQPAPQQPESPDLSAVVLGAMLLYAGECRGRGEDPRPGLKHLAGLVHDRGRLARVTGQAVATVQKAYWEWQERVWDAGGLVEKAKVWDEDKHPRGKDGRFIGVGRIEQARIDPAYRDELRKQVRPGDEGKFDAAVKGDGDYEKMPGTVRGQKRIAAHKKRLDKETSRKRADEIRARIKGKAFSATDLEEFATKHIPEMTVRDLRLLRKEVNDAHFGGKAGVGYEGGKDETGKRNAKGMQLGLARSMQARLAAVAHAEAARTAPAPPEAKPEPTPEPVKPAANTEPPPAVAKPSAPPPGNAAPAKPAPKAVAPPPKPVAQPAPKSREKTDAEKDADTAAWLAEAEGKKNRPAAKAASREAPTGRGGVARAKESEARKAYLAALKGNASEKVLAELYGRAVKAGDDLKAATGEAVEPLPKPRRGDPALEPDAPFRVAAGAGKMSEEEDFDADGGDESDGPPVVSLRDEIRAMLAGRSAAKPAPVTPSEAAKAAAERLRAKNEAKAAPPVVSVRELAEKAKGPRPAGGKSATEATPTPAKALGLSAPPRSPSGVKLTAGRAGEHAPAKHPETREAVKKVFGSDIFADEANHGVLAAAANAHDGAEVHVVPHDGHVKLKTTGDGYYAARSIRKVRGKLVATNESFDIEKNDDGTPKNASFPRGADMLANQVRALRHLGVSRIDTLAAGRASDARYAGKTVGYTVWPRLGFDGTMPKDVVAKLPPDLKKHMGASRSVLKLHDAPGGKEWWEKNGKGMRMRFDLSDGSPSMRKLEAYLKERDAKGGKS